MRFPETDTVKDIGRKDTAAHTGAVDDATTVMGYVKQVVTDVSAVPTTAMRGTDNAALATTLEDAMQKATAPAYSQDTDSLEAISEAVALIPTTMVGTDNAALATTLEDAMQKATGPSYNQDTDSLEAISEAVASIPTTAMRGTDNAFLASAGGALTDATATGAVSNDKTAMSYLKQITTYTESGAGQTLNIPQFAGTIAYVDAAAADDTADGLHPTTPKKTINAAIAIAGAGGAVSIKAGTYSENVVMNQNSQDLWPEIGTIINPASGTPLSITGNYCKVWCPGGSLRINPGANETGVSITGVWAYVSDVRVFGNSSADIGFHIGSPADNTNGDGSVLYNCRCSSPLIAAFKIQADKVKLDECCTGGDAGNSSIGFWMTPDASGAIDKTRLRCCGSQGHETSGFQVDSGVTNAGIKDCYSGGGDGRWIDVDNAAVWSGFTYDDVVVKNITFSAAGPTSASLFIVTGVVLITGFYANVKTVLSADIGNGYVRLYDGANDIDVTDSPGPSFNSLPVGSYIHKIDDAGTQIAIMNSSQVRLYEDATKHGRDPNFQILGKAGATTYIQFTYSGAGTSGVLRWHCKWRPLTNDGFVSAA